MSLVDEDRVNQMNPVFCVLDRKRRDEANRLLYSKAQQAKGIALKEYAYNAYGCRPQVYLNYQETFMTVKVTMPKPSEKNRSAVTAFNARCLAQGIEFKEVKGGVVYHFV